MGGGEGHCNTGWTESAVCTHTSAPTYAHAHLNPANTHVVSRSRSCTLHTVFERRFNHGDTHLGERRGGGGGRLWVPGEMSSQSTDTHLVATSIPISSACHSTCCAHNRLTPPPLQGCRLSQKKRAAFFGTIYLLLMGKHAVTMPGHRANMS